LVFFQLIARRYEKASTIFTSNKTFSQWSDIFADVTIASAILDRVLHHCNLNHYECSALESLQGIEDELTDVAAKSVDNRVMYICAMRYPTFLYALQKSKTPINNTASCRTFAHEMVDMF